MKRPFANACEYMDWMNENCCKCRKVEWLEADFDSKCPIIDALSMASLIGGLVDDDLYTRMGGTSGVCPEIDREEGDE